MESRLEDEVDLELQSSVGMPPGASCNPRSCIPASLAGPTAKRCCRENKAAGSGSYRPIRWVPTETTNLEFALMKFLRLDRSR